MLEGLDGPLQALIVDLAVQDGTDPQFPYRQCTDSPGFQIRCQCLVTGPIQILEVNEQDVGLGRIGRQLHAVQIAQPIGQFATTAMILGESIDAFIESDQTRSSDHSDLAHAAAEHAAAAGASAALILLLGLQVVLGFYGLGGG